MARLDLSEEVSPAHEPHTLLISVAHGDLRRATYPLAIGHYHGDTIVHAEKILDQQLSGRLTELFNLYLYPGPKGTAEVIRDPHARPPGALIIGLGDVGEIQPATVRDGLANAALRYAIAHLNEARNKEGGVGEAAAPLSTGISTLLLGTYGGNSLSVEASLSAIIQGVARANEALRSVNVGQPPRGGRGGAAPRPTTLWDLVRIDEVEIVELYEDVALAAVSAASYLAAHPPSSFPKGDKLRVVPPHINPIGNGRFQRPSDPYTGGWWRRIRITSEKLADGGEGLRFLALTDRARAEDTLQYTQRGFIEELVRRAIKSAAGADALATVLFSLLVPNSLKDQARAEADLLLVLDAASAQYPWELLAERTRDDKIDPLALRAGLIRQFQTSDFTQNPQPARGQNALVIGEPKTTNQAPLPGARREAEAVAKVLREREYTVTALINNGSIELLNALFAKGYKILHIAGHGEYVRDNPGASGVILDNGVLSPITMRNLTSLPELVFLNCCHLGKLDAGGEPRLRLDSPHALAASISEELIKMGVKAVVAAGWAVEDNAAAEFASVFYQKMLEGRKFGEAVKEARQAASQVPFKSNTWGAYQCYGNPDFVLSSPGDGSQSARQRDEDCFTRGQYLERLADIASEAARADDEAWAQELRNKLTKLREDIPPDWVDGELLGAFGKAWAELRNYQQAMDFYSKTKTDEKGRGSFMAVQQLASMRVKYAESLFAGGETGPEVQRLIDDAIADLRWLLGTGVTGERLSLLGGSYKRKAAFAGQAADRQQALREAELYYGLAHFKHLGLPEDGVEGYFKLRTAKERRRWLREVKAAARARLSDENAQARVDSYAALNWLTYRLLLGESIGEDLELVRRVLEKSGKGGGGEITFWSIVAEADTELLRSLSTDSLGGENLAKLRAQYDAAFARGATLRERAIVTDHFKFLRTMLADLNHGGEKQATLDALDSLYERFKSAAPA